MSWPLHSSLPQSCSVCGHTGGWLQGEPITADLAGAWKLHTKEKVLFDLREGRLCPECKSSLRTQSLATMLLQHYNLRGTFDSFIDFATEQKLRVLEINGYGTLTDKLAAIPNIIQTEYGSSTKPSEDIQSLSFADKSFDLVLHSETLEHVPDPAAAMQECVRVMTDTGACLFSTPMLLQRTSVQCKQLANGKPEHMRPVSYHGYAREDYEVWWEFGQDILATTNSQIVYAQPRCVFYGLGVFGPAHKPSQSHVPVSVAKVAERLAVLTAPQKLTYNL